jgi:hypothetical protein
MSRLHVSKYHPWFVEMGYPQLDINEYPDGEWEIIEYQNAPIIPSLTRYKAILSGLRNIEPTKGFVAKYIAQIDPQRKAFWDRERARTKLAEHEAELKEKHADELSTRATKAIMANPDLMDRIARNGLQEMDLDKIRQHVPTQKL